MPRSSKPPKVLSDGHRCPKSPTGSHWWLVDPPSGKICTGVCRYCGKQRQFANTVAMALHGSTGK